MTVPASGRETFYGTQLRPEEIAPLVNAIVAGGQFSATLNRVNTTAASTVFPIIDTMDEPEWTNELDTIPLLGLEGEPLVVAPSRLSGIVLISLEALEDGNLNVTAQIQDVLRAKFSSVLERDLLTGSGTAPVPAGLIAAAPETTADNLWEAVVTGKAEIATNGGIATHLVAAPALIAAEESRVDADGRPLWPTGLADYAGVQIIPAAAADPPLLYDSSRVSLLVRTDYAAELSREYTPAFERYAAALRLTARLAAAAPVPAMSMRRLEVGATRRTAPAKKAASS